MMKAAKASIAILWLYLCFCKILPRIVKEAFTIRLKAIEEYGLIIHEFDPYFNLRATEYLYDHGAEKFFKWFDYKVWYPLGRPVGTTIYPGMQFTAVWIKNFIFGDRMSLNDICCFIPAWFGVIATICTSLLAYECSLPVMNKDEEAFCTFFEKIPIVGWIYSNTIKQLLHLTFKPIELVFGTDFGLRNKSMIPSNKKFVDFSSPAVEIALFAGAIMSVVPAHLMRSMGGGYDNESVAVAAMTLTFYLWTRSLRGGMNVVRLETWFWGMLTGVAYFYMVAAWGGYVFVINLIGVHAGVLVLLGRFSTKLYRAYTAFYIVGTALAIQVPVVGWAPLKSLEQLGPCGVFLAFQVIQFIQYQKRKHNLSWKDTCILRIKVLGIALILFAALCGILQYKGYFGPISARVRGLFVKHTKTGNPLVDSVAEHQPAQSSAYKQYLDHASVISPIGFILIAFRYFHDSSSFLLVYGLATYFFSLKMVRLILLTAPIASILTGVVLGRFFGLIVYNVLGFLPSLFDVFLLEEGSEPVKSSKKQKKNGRKNKELREEKSRYTILRSSVIRIIFIGFAYLSISKLTPEVLSFYERSNIIASHLSSPTIVQKGQLKSGGEVIVDDYRECYWWIRDNTPEDARIMAWWDYGYQLTAIANRTTIADGNTWNHEHIALLARALTSPEVEGHRIARHLADYVLVWAGGGGDDVAKSPHLARIANSVYRSMCPGDPTCSKFTYTQQGAPSKMMRESLLFKLHSHGIKPGVIADSNRFREKFSSRYGKCRVFKVQSVALESKKWVENPANKKCDAPGSWFCPGQYPPGLDKILKEKRDFSQLEDFNKDDTDSEYQKKYFENLEKKRRGESIQSEDPTEKPKKKPWKPDHDLSPETIEEINGNWEDNPTVSALWEMISQNKVKDLIEVLTEYPELAHVRSADGRGPMFWAMEYENSKIVRILKKVGVSDTRKDANGMTPLDLKKDKSEL